MLSNLALKTIADAFGISSVGARVSPVHGGSINYAYRIAFSDRVVFVKCNDTHRYPEMFEKEQEGLFALKKAVKVGNIPEVLQSFELQETSYLVLEYIESGPLTKHGQALLGEMLASIHKTTFDRFGWPTSNYMGSLVQKNYWHSNWADFFVEQRIKPQLIQAVDQNLLPSKYLHTLDDMHRYVSNCMDAEKPTLVHGDLWGGNYLLNPQGTPYLFDPAVAFSCREVDLAMSTLFGGFDAAFYEHYCNCYPLQPEWEERLKIWNLYPLLIHVNLFGESYTAQTLSVLNRF